MATSGSTDFTINRDQLITGALRLIGAIAQGETPSATMISEASEALNLMVKAWQVDGLQLWALKTYAVPLTVNTNTYLIGSGQTVNTPKPLRVIRAWYRNTSNIDIPVRVVTRDEYDLLGNKTITGSTPSQINYLPQVTYGTLSVFPTPDSIAATGNLYIVYQRPFEDFDASIDEPDFPSEWFEAIKYGLAVRLAPEYGIDTESRRLLIQEATTIKSIAMTGGLEEGSLYFGVSHRE